MNGHVRYWPRADIRKNASTVVFGGKADIMPTRGHVCF